MTDTRNLKWPKVWPQAAGAHGFREAPTRSQSSQLLVQSLHAPLAEHVGTGNQISESNRSAGPPRLHVCSAAHPPDSQHRPLVGTNRSPTRKGGRLGVPLGGSITGIVKLLSVHAAVSQCHWHLAA
jgi:hypothetical protein